MQHFKEYSHKTGNIKIYPIEGKRMYIIVYYKDDVGITWLLKYNSWDREFKQYTIV